MESLVELLRLRVSETPDATALVSDGLRLSYAELDRATDRAADRLAATGLRPGARAGLLVERDAETIVWMLAILKQAAAYVPLDPDYPPERTRFIAEDAQLSCIVGARSAADRLGLLDHRLIDRAAPATDPGSVIAHDAVPAPSADSTAYVIYTSGSTGTPKGCVITHGNVLAFLEGALPQFNLTADDRWALVTSLCFDVSVWELWGALATGATAVVVPWRMLLSPDEFIGFLQEQGITVLTQVPSVFRYTANAYARRTQPQVPLRYLFLAGESVNLDVVKDFLDGAGPSSPTVVNGYGPTEATVLATFKVLDAETVRASVASPIGQPFPHTGAHILNAERTPVPDGTPGELWLSGPSLATGYLHRDDLTRERFVELPLGPGRRPARCYRTGDIVRRLPDGNLEYLGRDDDQIKIRGFRIELREIETVLGSHPEVLDVAVCLVDAVSGPALAACVVCANSFSDALAESMRDRLKASLPDYMVPRLYTSVDRLPLTPSGKLDRAAVAGLFSHLIQI